MITYRFDKDTQILQAVFFGHIDSKEIIDFQAKVNSDSSLPSKLRILINARTAKIDISPNDSKYVALENFKLEEHYTQIKTAFLTDSPEDTALVTLYKHYIRSKKYHFRIFSESENAIDWLSY